MNPGYSLAILGAAVLAGTVAHYGSALGGQHGTILAAYTLWAAGTVIGTFADFLRTVALTGTGGDRPRGL
jgi:hypothetical protein